MAGNSRIVAGVLLSIGLLLVTVLRHSSLRDNSSSGGQLSRVLSHVDSPPRLLRRSDDDNGVVLDGRYIEDVEFIFGYSTGHVGTSSFAERERYGEGERQDSIRFRHEWVETKLKHDVWITYNEHDEYNFVRQQMFPTIMESLKAYQKTYFDNGHHVLYFIYGLLRFMNELKLAHPNFDCKFLRIRRNRVESAISLEHPGSSHKHHEDPTSLITRYHPFERPHEVILKLNEATWDSFTDYQKALWIVDETEARWQHMVNTLFPLLNYTDIYWESTPGLSNYTFNQGVRVIAGVLKIPENQLTYEADFTQPHMNDAERQRLIDDRTKLKKEDEQYQAVMAAYGHTFNFSYLPPTYNSYEVPES
jgi:hypothetical protein